MMSSNQFEKTIFFCLFVLDSWSKVYNDYIWYIKRGRVLGFVHSVQKSKENFFRSLFVVFVIER